MPTLNPSNLEPFLTSLKRNLRLTFLALMMIGLVLLGACTDPATPAPAPTSLPTATSSLVITSVPGIAATVTAVYKLPPLSPEQAGPYLEIRDLVLACEEFHPNRRITLLQHLDWLTNPSQVPPELINLYGNDVPGQLTFGAAYTVAVEWKNGGRQAASCLIPIGDRLNVILVELGRQPVPEFATP